MDAFDLLVVPRVDKQNPNGTHGFINTATQEKKKKKESCDTVRCFHVSPKHIVGIQIRCNT